MSTPLPTVAHGGHLLVAAPRTARGAGLRRAAARVLVVTLALISAGCSSASPSGSMPPADVPSEPLECAVEGYACSWSDVAPEVLDRSRTLAREAMDLVAGGSVDAAVEWLNDQPDMASVSSGEGAVRFRLDGGRPTWLVVGGKGADAAATARLAGHIAGVGDPRFGIPSGPVDPPPPGVVVGEGREAKRAIVLAPFAYVPSMGAGEVAALLSNTRGYAGGVTLLENAGPGSQTVTLDTLASLDGNDVVYLDSFGGTTTGRVYENGEQVGETAPHGFIAVRQVGDDFHLSDENDVGLDIVLLEDGAWYLAVSRDFFSAVYPGGVDKALIVLQVDRLSDQWLLRALKGAGSEVYAWNGGIDSEPARSRVMRFLADLAETGRSTTVVYHEMADYLTLGEARFVGYTEKGGQAGTRIRETPWLRHPDDGSPLTGSEQVRIIGELGDDEPDTVPWMIEIDGVDLATGEPQDTTVALTIDTLPAWDGLVAELEQVDDYGFRAEGKFELPYDLPEGATLTLEAIVNLPDGGTSRHTVTVGVTDRTDLGTVWQGEATKTHATFWPGVTVTMTASIEFTRLAGQDPDDRTIDFVVTGGTMSWSYSGSNDDCTFDGSATVPLDVGERAGVLTFDVRDPGAVTYFGSAGVNQGPEIEVEVSCVEGSDKNFITRADGDPFFAPRDLKYPMDGPSISGTYTSGAKIGSTHTWAFERVR